MLDENLPTFFLKPTTDGIKHNEAFYFTQHGSDPEATYLLKHVDPATPEARNTYAAALFDTHSPDVLYAEVLAKPGWTQPTLSQEEIRRNGGVAPPPQPIFPTEFAIQLYNPDQQIVIKQHTSKWTNAITFEFSMPQTTFRMPSASTLDRSQNDPAADAVSPRMNFVWRKEGRIGKDMTCYLTGKSTDITGKKAKKNKEPDIAVALFSGLKEMTIMEPNLYRVEMEDYKGLELVLLLGAAVIRDIFFSNARETFHIFDPTGRKNSGGILARKASSPSQGRTITPPVLTPQPPRQSPVQAQGTFSPVKSAAVQGLYNKPPPRPRDPRRASLPHINTSQQQQPGPRLDPRAQWEVDAETARLKAQVEAEAREQKRQEEQQRRARKKSEDEEARRTRKFLEQEDRQRRHEEKERQRREAEVERETQRLRRQYGDQSNLLPIPEHHQPRPTNLHPPRRPEHRHSLSTVPQHPPQHPMSPTQSGPYLHPYPPRVNGAASASQSTFFSNGLARPPDAGPKMKKKSFWGLRSVSDSSTNTLRKKSSSMF
ncbi:hypothetical protein M011DRAFT_529648 [Sporormia fimetaria CBS 119925]|uniref:Uncharacterized protein n=1 Tax=Sporormia fimetaria CBS 119925 TaxID=1340428 RepID=A0A6A6UZH1_9PLEO|nr:hypothetical protein M011DRAFT_529648 [Sporormia fimetaria CBS 119925]